MSCKKAIGIANEMKKVFGDKINLTLHTTDSPEAQKYNFRSSTNVLFEGEMVPLKTALDKDEMEQFLSKKMS